MKTRVALLPTRVRSGSDSTSTVSICPLNGGGSRGPALAAAASALSGRGAARSAATLVRSACCSPWTRCRSREMRERSWAAASASMLSSGTRRSSFSMAVISGST